MISSNHDLLDQMHISNMLQDARQALVLGQPAVCLDVIRTMKTFHEKGLLDEAELAQASALAAAYLKLVTGRAA
jgi:hypothetical protein